MGLFSKATGIDRRDELTVKAIKEADAYAAKALERYTVTVHSTYGGSALLPRLTPFVVKQLQAAGHEVLGVQTDDWSYNAHISCRAASVARPPEVPRERQQQGNDNSRSDAAASPRVAAPSARTGYMHGLPAGTIINESLDFINWAMSGRVPTPLRAQIRGWALERGSLEVAVVPLDGDDPGLYASTDDGREVQQWVLDHDVWAHPQLVGCGPPSVVWFDAEAFDRAADAWTLVKPT